MNILKQTEVFCGYVYYINMISRGNYTLVCYRDGKISWTSDIIKTKKKALIEFEAIERQLKTYNF